MSTRSDFFSILLRSVTAPVLMMSLLLALPVHARFGTDRSDVVARSASSTEPASTPGDLERAPAGERAQTGPDSIEQALEAGDLSGARELAVKQRSSRPEDPQSWKVEADVHERAGDLTAAIAAWKGYLRALPADASPARKTAEERIARLEARRRGTIADEPKSTHRAELDGKRVAAKPRSSGVRQAAPAAQAEDRLVKKWYFWVTLAAIVASAAAITGIAIKAGLEDQPDAIDVQVGDNGPLRSTPLFRF